MVPGVQCVLLGVAEVKVPVKRLAQETLTRVAEVAGWAVIHEGHEDTKTPGFAGDRDNFIGEVDSYYALQEVEIKLDEEGKECQIIQGGKVILQHRSKDVAVVVPIEEHLRVVYISKSDSFVRVAVVLQMKSKETMDQLIALFPDALPPVPMLNTSFSSDGDQSSGNKETKTSSLGRSMSKLTNKLKQMSSITASTGLAIASSPKPKRSNSQTQQAAKTQDLQDLNNSDSDSNSDEDSVTDISDDTDSKSTGGYYGDMGQDATVQEHLYDRQTSDTYSKCNDASLETNTYKIKAELQFFLETDSIFLKSLKSLSEDRERLTKAATPPLLRGKVFLLFSQISALTELHTALHEDFEKSNGNLQILSDAIVSRQREYEKYVYFIENIPVVDEILETHKDYLKENMPEFAERIRKPRMRLHYYVLTLETLCKMSCYPEDKEALQKAIDVLKVPLKKADSKLFLGAVDGSPIDLSNFGNLIRHSDLMLRKGGDLHRRVYHVFMLKTLILITLRNKRNYDYVASFRMDQVGLGTQERGLIFDLKVRGPRGQTEIYVFKAKNINLQQQWINDLKSIVKDSTPRTNYDEWDKEIRSSGRRKKITQKSSVESVTSSGSSVTTGSCGSSGWDENSRSSSSEHSSSRNRRMGAIRRSTNSVQQNSGSFSDSESNWNKRRMADHYVTLNVWTYFEELKDFFYQREKSFRCFDSTAAFMEKKYIEDVRSVLGGVLNEEIPKPPPSVITIFRHIIEFHKDIFLPLIEKASSQIEVAECFNDCSERMKECYAGYFVQLTRYYEEFQLDQSLNHFKLPLNHFMNYVSMLNTYQRREKNVIPQVQVALSLLRDCITESNVMLLNDTIRGAPFDLQEHAPALHEGSAKVRWTGLMMRQDCYLVLFESMLLLLEPYSSYYRYVDALRMDTVGLGPVADKHSFQLEVRTGATKTILYTFRTSSSVEKDVWLRAITDLLKLQVERLKERQKRRLGTNQGEMVTVGCIDRLHENHILVTDL